MTARRGTSNDSRPGRGPAPADGSPAFDHIFQVLEDLDAVNPAARARHERLLRHLLAEPTRRLLDAGCGTGHFLAAAARSPRSLELHGADDSAEARRAARGRVPTAQIHALDLAAPLPATHAGAFDAVVCSEVLEHVADDAFAVRQLAAALRPGGRLLVSVPGGTPNRFDRAIGHLRHYTPTTLHDLLVRADLDPLSVHGWGFPVHDGYRLLVAAAARLLLPGPADHPPRNDAATTDALAIPGSARLAYRLAAAVLTPAYRLTPDVGRAQLFAVARRRAR